MFCDDGGSVVKVGFMKYMFDSTSEWKQVG